MPRQHRPQFVTAKTDAYPDITSVHGIKKGQRLRVVMRLPASRYTYDRDVVVLDTEDGGPPICLWEQQINEAVR